MISKSQALAYIKHERSQLLPLYWQRGYKVIGYLGGAYSKLPWKTPIRRRPLSKKTAQRMMASLVKSDPSLRHQLRLTSTPIGWVPICNCEKNCTHRSPVFAIRAALEVHLSQAEDVKWCARHHWWWVKGSYGWIPLHSSVEPCLDRYRIPRPLEKALDGWEGKVPINWPNGSLEAFSLHELRERIRKWLPEKISRRDPQEKYSLADEFLTKIVSGETKFPYWCDFEMDKNGRLANPKKKLAVYIKRAVRHDAIDTLRREQRIQNLEEEQIPAETRTPEDLLFIREEAKRRYELGELFFSKLSTHTGRPVEQIKALIEVHEIENIKTLVDELKTERTKLYREVIYPIREEAKKPHHT